MSNLTISLDDELIKKARVRAIQEGTSLSAKVRDYLQQYVNGSSDDLQRQREAAAQRLLSTLEQATKPATNYPHMVQSPRPPRTSLREDLYAGDFRSRERQDLE